MRNVGDEKQVVPRPRIAKSQKRHTLTQIIQFHSFFSFCSIPPYSDLYVHMQQNTYMKTKTKTRRERKTKLTKYFLAFFLNIKKSKKKNYYYYVKIMIKFSFCFFNKQNNKNKLFDNVKG